MNAQAAVAHPNVGFGHHPASADPGEIAARDAGACGRALARTGASIPAFGAPGAGTLPACRFFTVAFAPTCSHIRTAVAAECAYRRFTTATNRAAEGIAFCAPQQGDMPPTPAARVPGQARPVTRGG
ncbi:hypothetical protein BURK1_01475 [Burkholderiales bacterium]|nr:hypothetical protein BURK1_01475 [Burkholderiales bacterium]